MPPSGEFPLSRGAPERRLTERRDHYDRAAVLTAYEPLTSTGTVRLTFDVLDDHPFVFRPGYFVGIRAEVGDLGARRSPYCIISPPDGSRSFQLLVRLVPEGPLSLYLAGLDVGDEINFRGPSGRSMIPRRESRELVLLATGVGIGPLLSLTTHLLSQGFDRPITLYWGLRLEEDICLVDVLDDLAARSELFRYHLTLSRPSPRWTGLRGRITETVPPLLETLGGKHFYLVGNGAMIEEMECALSDMGVDDVLLHHECYFNVRHRADPRVLAEIRSRFRASDLFNPYEHQEAGLYIPERPASRRRRRVSG